MNNYLIIKTKKPKSKFLTDDSINGLLSCDTKYAIIISWYVYFYFIDNYRMRFKYPDRSFMQRCF